MINKLKGLGALLLLTGLVVGLPWVLVQLAAQPGFFPTRQRLQTALTAPDDGRLLLVLIWGIGWLTWLGLAWLVTMELLATIRGFKAPRIPALTIPQGLIHSLVVTAALLFIAAPLAITPAAADTNHPGDDTNPSSATATENAPTTNADPVTVTVQPGGSLWEYAEDHLSDGARWPEIYDQNRGGRQPDGGELTNPDLINPGWKLTIPTPQHNPDSTDPGTGTGTGTSITVEANDTLWGLAAEHLGDGNLWTEIYDHNRGVVQADGEVLTDPDLIQPGWVLTLPSTADSDKAVNPNSGETSSTIDEPSSDDNADELDASPEPDASAEQEDPATQEPMVASTATPAPERVPEELQEDEELPEQSQWVPSWQVNGLIGAGAFLGAGLFTVLHRRRKDQFRQRQPGLTIVTPDPVVAPIEMTAKTAAGLSGDRLTRLDTILRHATADIETLPTVTTVRVDKNGTITLQSEDELPNPWQPAPGGWTLSGDIDPETIGTTYPDQPAPYPTLVTVGVDDHGNTWLLNLEAFGIIDVSGDDTMREDFIRYIAAELAVNPWATHVQVACLGIATETIPMDPDRFTPNSDHITNLAKANIERAHRANTDAATGRERQLEDEAWSAVVVITNDTSHVSELEHLIETNPQNTGAAIVACTRGSGDLHLTTAGRLTGPEFDLVAVGLTTDEAAGCAALLAAADDLHPGTPVPAADHLTDQTGNLLQEVTLPRANTTDDSTEPVLPEADETYVAAAPITVTDLQLLATGPRKEVAQEILDRDPNLDRDVEAWFSPNCQQPRLTWLGPVRARCHGKPPTKSKAYYTEVLSYLAAHPDGVTNDQIVDAFNITPQRARTVISNLRQWVGTNPSTGQHHIPDAKESPQAIASGVGLYLVQDLLNDADLFRRLRTRAQASAYGGIADLEKALTLVTGRPFEQLRPAGWNWLIDGDRIDHHMTCAIGDVSHTLVTYHLQNNNPQEARRAVGVALSVCPASETAILDLAACMAGDGEEPRAGQRVVDSNDQDRAGDPIDISVRASQILQTKRHIKAG